jgi:hypothetical protein
MFNIKWKRNRTNTSNLKRLQSSKAAQLFIDFFFFTIYVLNIVLWQIQTF